jgi:hypothetical protein
LSFLSTKEKTKPTLPYPFHTKKWAFQYYHL